ncbi:rolling circle replication-associated protein [Horticoccus sp. 23ND18S-11]|uniref:rolling circle replication-associated protein n=1 Tax=Horticoccus sp. 23ND18S-11 TaxID=3391832 RepID=UPI0039C9A436
MASFVEHWGRNHCLFFTLTDEANLHPTQFARRWNSYLVRNGAWIKSYIRVLEPQKQGRPHYHLLVAVAWDTRADSFDWSAFDECQQERKANGPTPRFRELRARYKASAAPELVALWSLLRKVLPRYGLGRAELLPLRKGKEAISEYVGKYLEAGLTLRRHSWKGCRRVEFDRRGKTAWLRCTRVFAWHSPGAIAWRKRVGELGSAIRVEDIGDIRRRLGIKWAYRLREAITLASSEDWQLLLDVLAEMQSEHQLSNGSVSGHGCLVTDSPGLRDDVSCSIRDCVGAMH